jgi:hypothetical protein
MRAIRRLVCALAVALCMGTSFPATATSFTTDQSDLWFIPAESGWGMQLVQRNSVIFATLYVYDVNLKPTWFVATLTYEGTLGWQGDLLATTGPWFGTTPFDSSTVTGRKVGTMTWNNMTVNTGKLSYDVDGVPVVKNVVRESLALEDYSAHYAGAIHRTLSACTNPSMNLISEDIGVMYVNQTGTTFELTHYPLTGGSCTYTGTLAQAGQMGSVSGSYSCSSGETGTFAIFEMQGTPQGISGRMTSLSPALTGCQGDGWFGGTLVTTY